MYFVDHETVLMILECFTCDSAGLAEFTGLFEAWTILGRLQLLGCGKFPTPLLVASVLSVSSKWIRTIQDSQVNMC